MSRGRLAPLALLAGSLVTSGGLAQSPRSGAPTPGKSVAGADDADAAAVNASGLALLPGRELRAQWTGGAGRPDRGVSASLAAPLVLDFSGVLRVDHLMPSGSTGHTWVSAALAYQYSPTTSIGASLGRSYSDAPARDGSFSLSPGMLWRPSAFVGLGAVVRNLNDPDAFAPRSFEVGALLRPSGRRGLEIGVDALRLERRSTISPRVTLGLALPRIGKLRLEGAMAREGGRESMTAALGLELGTGGAALSGGAWAGDDAGYFLGVSSRDFRDGEGAPRHFVRLRIEATPGDRGHTRLLRILWRLAESPDVAGVALHLKAEPASSLAHAEELGDALRMLRSRGKKSLCLADDAGARALFVCSQADRVFVNPGGGVRFAGLKAQYVYLGGLIEKLGGHAEFVRVAEHKTAPEQFTQRGPTPTADADHRELLQQLEGVYLHDLGGGRKISLPELQDRIKRGPFSAREAREAGLIDAFAHDDELDLAVADVEGKRVPVVPPDASPMLSPRHDEIMGSRDRVAIVYIDGDMVDGRSRSVPLLGSKTSGSYTVAAALKAARDDSRVRAVVLRLETPGGSALAADALWREVSLTAQRKPVIASMGTSAASAGYYVASAATEIFASRSTLTGSIGIYYGKGDAAELLKKLGVNVATYRTTPRADADSQFRPFTDDERKALGERVKQLYDLFVDRVARGRRMTPAEVDAVARGKVWTGQQARDHRLVDQVGGLREAIERARALGKLPGDAPIVELPAMPRDLLATALELAGLAQATEPAALPPHLARILVPATPFLLYDPDTPMARIETLFETP